MRRNEFTLSHEHKLSVDMGLLVPVATLEVLPGDSFIHAVNVLARVAPLVNPVMHSVDIRVHNWYVPNRLLWDEWEEWIVGKSVAAKPTVTVPAGASDYALLDHMGVPPATGSSIDALPIRAYNMVYNTRYRDQDLQAERTEDQLGLARICWEKDYYTTARAAPQQGQEVQLGFSTGQVPVVGAYDNSATGDLEVGTFRDRGLPAGTVQGTFTAGAGANLLQARPLYAKYGTSNPETNASFHPLYADLVNSSAGISIDDLRRSIALQRFAEARMRFGSRYEDYLRFLGINPRDGRLDRPEHLGSGKQQINFSEVIAMAEGASSAVGDLYGHGIASLRAKRYRKMFEEHGWVLSLLSVRPRTVYMDGINRKFQRFDPMDHWQKELEVLPWQEVKETEVYHAGSPTTVFGYVPRYDEYRQEMSYVSGSFRSGPEIDWHMARSFASTPALNGSFVECTPTDRIYGDVNMPELLMNIRHSIKARRLVRSAASIQSL